MHFSRKICVFSELARMFWSSEETTGDDPVTYLFSSTLAGTDVKPLYRVTADMVIQDLRVDHVDNRLYWLDRRDKLIYRFVTVPLRILGHPCNENGNSMIVFFL